MVTDSVAILINVILRQLHAPLPTPPQPSTTSEHTESPSSYALAEFELTAETREPKTIVVCSNASGGRGNQSSQSGAYNKVFEWWFPLLSLSLHYQQEVEQDPWYVASLSAFFDAGSFNFGIINFVGTVLDAIHFPAELPTEVQRHSSLDNSLPYLSQSTVLSENGAGKEPSCSPHKTPSFLVIFHIVCQIHFKSFLLLTDSASKDSPNAIQLRIDRMLLLPT